VTDETHSSARLDSIPRRLTRRPGVGCSRTWRQLTINQRTTCRWSLEEDVAGCEQAGLGGLGLWRPKLAEFGEERAVELIRDSGLAVSSLSWVGSFTGAHGYSFDDAVADGGDALALAAELGAAVLIVVSGPRLNHIRPHARRLVVDGLRALADDAENAGVTLGLEPMRAPQFLDWTFLSTLDETLDVVDACDHRAVKLVLDTFHLGREPRLLERLPRIVPSIGLVQLADCRPTPRGPGECCLPGDGTMPLDEITTAVVAGGYDGFFEIEAWSEAIWGSDYDELLARSAAHCESLRGLSGPVSG
jgi:sugar phosphate isomerase/epimerase